MAASGLEFDFERSEARGFGVAATILSVLAVLSPWNLLSALMVLAFIACLWKFVFHGATVVSMSLVGFWRCLFQFTVAFAIPLVLSVYFVIDTPRISFAGLTESLVSPWILLPIAGIGWFSWAGGEQLDQEHPFRGFLIAATVLFVVCFYGFHGVRKDDYDPDTSVYVVDQEAAAEARRSGRVFGQYLFCVGVAYSSLLVKLMQTPTRQD